MELEIEQIRDQQKETWNKFSPGWKKWDELTMDFLKPMGDEIIKKLTSQEYENGGHLLKFQTSDIENGLYYFGIETTKQKTQKRFTVQN